MRILRAFLYTGFVACANMVALGAVAGPVDPALITGAMAKLIVAPPKPLPEMAFSETTLLDLSDQPASLAAFRGKWLVLNFWATWCVPCREEMPALDRLAALPPQALPDLAVVALATGPNPLPGVRAFLDKTGIKTLTVLRDPSQRLAHQMGVLGLPVTVIINPDGQEVARLIGGADWGAPEAHAVFEALAR